MSVPYEGVSRISGRRAVWILGGKKTTVDIPASPSKHTLFILLVASVLAVTLILFYPSIVQADGGPHEGSFFNKGVDACAGCHRAHTGGAERLLAGFSQVGLCYSCHGGGGTGADTDVENGIYLADRSPWNEAPASDDGAGLRAGGFEYAVMDPGLGGSPEMSKVSSSHSVDGSNHIAWGAGPISESASPGIHMSLVCTSCHNPHGNGLNRMLKPFPQGMPTDPNYDKVEVAEEELKKYTITYTSDNYRDISYSPEELGAWCSQCHTRYLAGSGAGSIDSGDAIFAYRHTTDNRSLTCVRCHLAHGTSSEMGPYSGSIPWPDGSASPVGDMRSSLLSSDNRTSCAQCHLDEKGYVIGCGDIGASCHKPFSNGSHDAHSEKTHGPQIDDCRSCHVSAGHNGMIDFERDVGLNDTGVCNVCHSRGGALDGVNHVVVGAKVNWATGVYDANGKLIPEKKDWCLGCHDGEPAEVNGTLAPDIAGDNSTYGYNISGHGAMGIRCTECHDIQLTHFDGEPRTYAFVSLDQGPQLYNDGYRLRKVDGNWAMDVPRQVSRSSTYTNADFSLCYSCHPEERLIGVRADYNYQFAREPVIWVDEGEVGTNFRNEQPIGHGWRYVGGPVNSHWTHLDLIYNIKDWDSDRDCDSDSNGTLDSAFTCVTCHDPHGARSETGILTPEMTRGDLSITSGSDAEYGPYRYIGSDEYLYPGGDLYCDARGCHGSLLMAYYREPI